MTERAEPLSNQERQFHSLKQDIISNLKARGAVSNTSAKQVGYEIFAIAEDQLEGGYQALYIDVDGKWVVRYVGNVSVDKEGSFDNGVLEYARLSDPQAKAIDRNFRDMAEESFEEGYQRTRRELRNYVEGNKEILAQGLLNTMESRLQELKSETYPYPHRGVAAQEQQPAPTWKGITDWYEQLPHEDRLKGRMHNQWSEGTPQAYTDIIQRLTIEERLLISIFEDGSLRGELLTVEEVQARPADYVEVVEQRRLEQRRRSLAESRGVPVESITDTDLQASYVSLKDQVEEALSGLSQRENTVIRERFGLEDGRSKSLKEVGQTIDRSKSTVWRIEQHALRKLRHPSSSKKLRDYLGDETAQLENPPEGL